MARRDTITYFFGRAQCCVEVSIQIIAAHVLTARATVSSYPCTKENVDSCVVVSLKVNNVFTGDLGRQ